MWLWNQFGQGSTDEECSRPVCSKQELDGPWLSQPMADAGAELGEAGHRVESGTRETGGLW